MKANTGVGLYVRVTQQLINDGWTFVTDENDVIIKAVSDGERGKQEYRVLNTATDLKDFLIEKSQDY